MLNLENIHWIFSIILNHVSFCLFSSMHIHNSLLYTEPKIEYEEKSTDNVLKESIKPFLYTSHSNLTEIFIEWFDFHHWYIICKCFFPEKRMKSFSQMQSLQRYLKRKIIFSVSHKWFITKNDTSQQICTLLQLQ